jgi:hypothetical protein
VVAEPDHQDDQEEQQLGGQHRLHHAQLAHAERCSLQAEDHQHQGEADQPDAPLEGVGHQTPAHGGGSWSVLHPDPLED